MFPDHYKSFVSLAQHYIIPINEVVAFGDASNDIPMLERAGYSIAVRNAYPDVKLLQKRFLNGPTMKMRLCMSGN